MKRVIKSSISQPTSPKISEGVKEGRKIGKKLYQQHKVLMEFLKDK